MSGRLHHEDRKELFWTLPLAVASVGTLGYVTRQFVFSHWFNVDRGLWGNPEGVGFLWGVLGYLVLIGYVLFFWTGMRSHVAEGARLIGLIMTVTLTVGVGFGAFSYLVQFKRVWADDAQRLGYLLGSAWVWVLIGSWKIVGMWLFGRRLVPLRGRFKSQPQTRRAPATRPYDGDLEEQPV